MNLGEGPLNEAEWQKRVGLEMIPRLEHRVDSCRLAIHHWRKVDLELVVERGGKEVCGDRPKPKQLLADVHTKGPLGAQDLRTPTEGVRYNVELSQYKLGEQMNSVLLAKAKDSLGHHIEGGRAHAPFLAQVRWCHRVVGEERHQLAPEEMEEAPDH